VPTTSFRQAAQARIRELEDRERARRVASEQRAAEQRAGQAADRERREQAQRDAAGQAAMEARERLARRYGIAAGAVVLTAEYRLFLIPHVAPGLAVAYRRPVRAHHPGGRAPRADTPAEPSSWSQQLGLQRELDAGVDPPLIVRGDQILAHADPVADRLVVDPAPGDLVPTSRGTT
jgi:hypothetical protein